MRSRLNQRGSALIMSMIVVMVIAAFGVAVIRFASREVAGATAGRKEAAVAACAEAARTLLMSQWKLLGANGVAVRPLSTSLGNGTNTTLSGGHYDQDPTNGWNATTQTWNSVNGVSQNVQVVKLDPLTVGSSYQVNDLTNRIGDTIQTYRVVVHCTQGTPPDTRQVEVEFALQYGL